MKKLLFISDCSLKQCHSVRDILYNLLNHEDINNCEKVIVNLSNASRIVFFAENIESYKTYRVPKMSCKSFLTNVNYEKTFFIKKWFMAFLGINDRIIRRIPHIRHIYTKWDTIQYLKKIITLEKPDFVVLLYISPIENFSKLCRKMNIPYLYMLYDTYIERPGISRKEFVVEDSEIKHSVGYYVPDFFVNAYYNYYPYKNIFPYYLPLLIPQRDVIDAYRKSSLEYEFTYFGQIQSFRNGDKMKEIFKSLGLILHIFSMENKKSDDNFVFHKAVSQNKLCETVASSKFLVAFDNGEPYSHYLPSKAYLYVSFTKPIIVFGNNDNSALIEFLKDYPYYYYFNTEKSSLDELKRFINSSFQDKFDEHTYSKYLDYLPQNALKGITTMINSTLNNNN